MSRREDIDNAIWSDDDFFALSRDAKLVYIWSWTNPRCGMAGIYKLPLPVAAVEIGMTVDEVRSCLVELSAAQFAFYEDGVLWVRTRVQHLRAK